MVRNEDKLIGIKEKNKNHDKKKNIYIYKQYFRFNKLCIVKKNLTIYLLMFIIK